MHAAVQCNSGTAQRDSSATTYDMDHWIACRLCFAGIRAAAAHKSEPTTESTAYYSAGKASGVKTIAVSCGAALVDVRHGLTSSAYDTNAAQWWKGKPSLSAEA